MAKSKKFTINVDSSEVMHTSISRSKGGYSAARMVVKKGDNEYMSINYEWEGDGIPSFAMDLMGFMQANKIKSGTVVDGMEDEYGAYLSRDIPKEDSKESMPNVCPNCGNYLDDCVCDGKKQLEKTREKRGKEKKV